MFLRVAAFEFRQNLRSPLFWAVFGIFFLLSFGLVTSDAVHIGGADNVHKNAPYIVLVWHLAMGTFFMFAAVAFVAGAVIRDDDTGFGPICGPRRLSKFDYLYGRFAGALSRRCWRSAAVTAGLIVGSLMPGLDPEQLSPFRPGRLRLLVPGHGRADAVFHLSAGLRPGHGDALHGLSVRGRDRAPRGLRPRRAFGLRANPISSRSLARWDPLGLFAFDIATTRYWTANDRNTLLPPLTGTAALQPPVLPGRSALRRAGGLAYPAVPGGMTAGRPRAPQVEPRRNRRRRSGKGRSRPLPVVRPRFDRASLFAQLVERTRFDMGLVFRSPVLWVILGLALRPTP